MGPDTGCDAGSKARQASFRWRPAAAALGLVAAGLLLALPPAQACSLGECAFPSQSPALESCPGGCVQTPREVRVVLYTTNGQQVFVDVLGVCVGVYAGFQKFPFGLEIAAGAVVRLPYDNANHIAVGGGAVTC